MSKINNLEDLKSVVLERWSELSNLSSEYLSEAGKSAMEAYRAVYWHCSFHENLKSLNEDEEFTNLFNIPSKHMEYYKVIRKVNRAIERALSNQ